jgi:hypothetical protein
MTDEKIINCLRRGLEGHGAIITGIKNSMVVG